jgi:hypothetical protein
LKGIPRRPEIFVPVINHETMIVNLSDAPLTKESFEKKTLKKEIQDVTK